MTSRSDPAVQTPREYLLEITPSDPSSPTEWRAVKLKPRSLPTRAGLLVEVDRERKELIAHSQEWRTVPSGGREALHWAAQFAAPLMETMEDQEQASPALREIGKALGLPRKRKERRPGNRQTSLF